MHNGRFGTWPGTMQAAQWGKREKKSASEESPAVAWGGGRGGGASATSSSDYLWARFALRFFFLFAPMRSPVPGYLGPGSAVEEKDKERGRITGSPSSKYEHRRGIGIVAFEI